MSLISLSTWSIFLAGDDSEPLLLLALFYQMGGDGVGVVAHVILESAQVL